MDDTSKHTPMKIFTAAIALLMLAGCGADQPKSLIGCTDDSAKKAGDAYAACMSNGFVTSQFGRWHGETCGSAAYYSYCKPEIKSQRTAPPQQSNTRG